MITDPLSVLARRLTPTRDPRFSAALRIIEAWLAGEEPSAVDWEMFPDRAAVVRYLVGRLALQPGEAQEIQPALAALYVLARGEPGYDPGGYAPAADCR